jgi:hypothetical protein
MSIVKEKLIPDTLMLEERAEASLNALIGVADEDYDYIPFFSGFFKSSPAWMSHGNWDFGSSHGRLVDAVILARAMSGSTYGEDVEQYYRKNLLSFFKADGLSYRRNSFSEEVVKEHQSKFEDSASMIDQRAVLLGLTTWYLATGDPKVKEAADKHCAALKRIARKERDSWYYPASEYTEHGWPSFDAVHTRLAVDPAAMWGRQVMPFIRYYEVTGNRDAYELAENFVSNIINRSGVFNADGSFNGALEYRNGHFHTRMGTLASIARFAKFNGDAALIQFVKKSFDWVLTQCTSFGWTPGDMHDQAYEHETCTLVDAISIGIALAKSGYPEYWGVVERFVRNQLTESQLLNVDWIEQADNKSMDIQREKTYYKVAERLRGAFAGYAAPNDFVYDGKWGRGHIMDVQTCCLGSGTRALYQVWNNIVTENKGRIYVNLLLNRGTKWLDVLSHMPHEGRVDFDINEDIEELLIRIPEWVPYGAVEIERKGLDNTSLSTGREHSWVNKFFLKLGAAKKGERITVTFPMSERTTFEKSVNLEYEVKWRGDDVIHITPGGTYYPLYNNRKVFEKAPMRKAVLRQGEDNIYE